MKKLLIYIAAFAMILAMNTSCEDMGSLEEHPKKVDATTFMANAKEVESVINSIYFQLRRDPGFSRYLIVLEEVTMPQLMIPGLPVVGWASPKIAGRCCIVPFVLPIIFLTV